MTRVSWFVGSFQTHFFQIGHDNSEQTNEHCSTWITADHFTKGTYQKPPGRERESNETGENPRKRYTCEIKFVDPTKKRQSRHLLSTLSRSTNPYVLLAGYFRQIGRRLSSCIGYDVESASSSCFSSANNQLPFNRLSGFFASESIVNDQRMVQLFESQAA